MTTHPIMNAERAKGDLMVVVSLMQLFELKYIIVASIYKKVKGRGLVLVGAPQSFWQNFDLACSAAVVATIE